MPRSGRSLENFVSKGAREQGPTELADQPASARGHSSPFPRLPHTGPSTIEVSENHHLVLQHIFAGD